MARKARRRRKSRAGTPGALVGLIETGQPWERPESDLAIDFDLYRWLTGHDHFNLARTGIDGSREAWGAVRDAFLAEHIVRYPGTRPWAWWYFDAPESRRCIGGDESVVAPWSSASEWFGVPSARGGQSYESQGAYLDRMGLFAKGEVAGDQGALEPDDPATAYVRSVLAGDIIAGPYVVQACRRHLEDLEQAPGRGLYFDRRKADHRTSFNRYMRHYEGAWAKKVLVAEPWQCFCQGSIFGWQRGINLRRFGTAVRFVARGNGKTFEVSGDGSYLLLADGESGAQIFSAATKKAQAKLSWVDAVKIRKHSALLKRLTRVVESKGDLTADHLDAFWRYLGKDSDTDDGLRPHGALADEIHAYKDDGVIQILKTAFGKRTQPLLDIISTAGFDPFAYGGEQFKVFAQMVDPENPQPADWAFVFLATLDAKTPTEALEEIRDESNWIKANPNLGVSVSVDDLRGKIDEARRDPSKVNNLLVKNFNVWVSQQQRWLPMDKWNACARTDDPIAWRKRMLSELRGERCYGGLDIATLRDLVSLNLIFPDRDPAISLAWFWLPEGYMRERVHRDQVRYDVWAEQGFIDLTEGDRADHAHIRSSISTIGDVFSIVQIGYDPWNAEWMRQRLENDGLKMVEIRQGYKSMSEPSKRLEAAIAEEQIEHGGNPVLSWNANNVSVDRDPAGNIKPSKANAQRLRIDGVVAMVIAYGRATLDAPRRESIYNQRGLATA